MIIVPDSFNKEENAPIGFTIHTSSVHIGQNTLPPLAARIIPAIHPCRNSAHPDGRLAARPRSPRGGDAPAASGLLITLLRVHRSVLRFFAELQGGCAGLLTKETDKE